MSQTQAPLAGGQFLMTVVNPNDVYVREDLTEEQRLFGQTAAEFMQKEVLPVVERLYKHDWDLTRQLMRKPPDLDLLRLAVPAAHGGPGPRLIRRGDRGERMPGDSSFGGTLGAPTPVGTLPVAT